jgi:outer membrane protein assembly factor BamB
MRVLRGERWLGRLVGALTATVLVAGCGWAQYRAGPAGTGFNAVESTLSRDNVARLAPAWSRQVGWIEPSRYSGVYAGVDSLSPLARSGSDLAVASPGGSVVLNATTGALRVPIQHSPASPNNDQSVAIADGRIVLSGGGTSTPAGKFSVHDLASGASIWEGGGCDFGPSAPVVSGGRFYSVSVACVGTHPVILGSRRLDDLSVSWSAYSCCDSAAAPAVAGDTAYFQEIQPPSYQRQLAALDSATGAVRWTVPLDPIQCGDTGQVVSEGRLYVRGKTFDATTGTKLWDWPTCAASSVVTVTPDTLYVPYRSSTGASRLQAVDAATGAARWSIPWNENVSTLPSIPAAANGLLFAAGGDKLVARDASNGAVLWRSPAITGTFSDPIVSDGMIFAMASDGAVHAYALP